MNKKLVASRLRFLAAVIESSNLAKMDQAFDLDSEENKDQISTEAFDWLWDCGYYDTDAEFFVDNGTGKRIDHWDERCEHEKNIAIPSLQRCLKFIDDIERKTASMSQDEKDYYLYNFYNHEFFGMDLTLDEVKSEIQKHINSWENQVRYDINGNSFPLFDRSGAFDTSLEDL